MKTSKQSITIYTHTSSINNENDWSKRLGFEGRIPFKRITSRTPPFGVDYGSCHGSAVIGNAEIGDGAVVLWSEMLWGDNRNASFLNDESTVSRGEKHQEKEEDGEIYKICH